MTHHPTLTLFLATLLLTVACSGGSSSLTGDDNTPTDSIGLLPGDSMLYGLACEGCNDTIVVVLSDLSANPDTFDVLEASRNRMMFGRPMVGDEIALLVNSDDSTVADMVVDLEQLKGRWCYQVTPTLRPRAGMSEQQQKEFAGRMPDSIRRRVMQPREYGMELLPSWQARPIGLQRQRNNRGQSPVTYPKLKLYRQWHLLNGRLVLTQARLGQSDSLGLQSDTADFVALRRDTLTLTFTDGKTQTYYRKPKL